MRIDYPKGCVGCDRSVYSRAASRQNLTPYGTCQVMRASYHASTRNRYGPSWIVDHSELHSKGAQAGLEQNSKNRALETAPCLGVTQLEVAQFEHCLGEGLNHHLGKPTGG
jgi:hypothetical protein